MYIMFVSGSFIGGRIWYTPIGNGWGLLCFPNADCGVDQEVEISVVFEVFDSG